MLGLPQETTFRLKQSDIRKYIFTREELTQATIASINVHTYAQK